MSTCQRRDILRMLHTSPKAAQKKPRGVPERLLNSIGRCLCRVRNNNVSFHVPSAELYTTSWGLFILICSALSSESKAQNPP
eukprot:6455422-Amphidinium_carterae.6